MVGRPSLHRRGFPLLLGGRGRQPGDNPGRAARGPSNRRGSPAVRGHRRNHGAFLVVEAEPVLPSGAGRGAAALPVPAGPLHETVPPALCRSRRTRAQSREGGATQLGGASLPQEPPVQKRQPGPAVAATVGAENETARRALRLRAQPVLSPGRRGGAAASLHRPRHLYHRQFEADSGQGRRRRGRPSGAQSAIQELHLPQDGGETERFLGAPVADGEGGADRALSQPQRQGPGLAPPAAPGRFPPRPVPRHRPPRDQPGHLLWPGPGKRQHGPAAKPALSPRVRVALGQVRHPRGQPAARWPRPHRAQPLGRPLAARRPPGGDHRRAGRRGNRADRRPRTDPRQLDEDRRQALHQAAPTRGVPQPHLRRFDPDVGVVRHGERGSHGRFQPPRTGPHLSAAVPVAEVGPVLRDRGPRRRTGRPRGGPGLGQAQPRVAHGGRPGTKDKHLAAHARSLFGPGFQHRPSERRPPTGGRQQPPAQRPRGRDLQLEPRRPLRHPPAGHLLVRRRQRDAGAI